MSYDELVTPHLLSFFARCLRFVLPHQSMRRLVMVASRPRRPCGSARCVDDNPWLAATGTDRSSSASARVVLKAYRVEIGRTTQQHS